MSRRTHPRLLALFALLILIAGGLVRPVAPAAAQEPEPPNTSLTLSGTLNLSPSVYVFAQSSTSYGIYFLEGSNWQLVTSIPVSAVTVDRVEAKLSPDGHQVAFLLTDGETGNSALYVTDRFGTTTRTIYSSNEPAMAVTSFAWHGADEVAYSLKRGPFAGEASDGTTLNVAEQAAQSPYAGEVWVSSIDGASQTQVVSQTAGLVLGSLDANSPIYYTAVNTQTEELIGLNSVAADGSVTELFRNQVDANGQGTVYHSFDLVQTAPGVTRIAVVAASEVSDTVPANGTRLLTADLNGSDVQTVLSDPLDIAGAVWSPDGTRVAFVRQSTGVLSIHDLSSGMTSTLPNAVRATIQWDADGIPLGNSGDK